MADRGRPIYIYALRDPDSLNVRYIGKAVDVDKRLKSHIRDSKIRNTPIYKWFRSLQKTPVITTECVTNEQNWSFVERRIIKQYQDSGHDLLNVALGGNQPFCDTQTRAENGRKNAAAIHADPQRKRLWKLKKELSANLRWLSIHGMQESADRIRARVELAGVYL